VEFIKTSLKREPVQMPSSIWGPLSKFEIIWTPQEEQRRLQESARLADISPVDAAYDSDVASTMSTSPKSVFSIDSSTSSATSSDSILEKISAVTEFTVLLVSDEKLKPLYIKAFSNTHINAYRFENNFRRLLKRFSVELRKEASNSLEKSAARFVGIRARDVAHNIREAYDTSSNDIAGVLREISIQRPGRSELVALERFITQREPSAVPLRDPSPFHEQTSEEEEQYSEDDELQDRDHEEIPSVRNVTNFIFSSKSFANLCCDFERFVQPGMLGKVRKEMMDEFRSSGEQYANFHVNWNLLECCKTELDTDQGLANILTVTGVNENAYATTCEEYLLRFWPKTAPQMLRILDKIRTQASFGKSFQ